MLLYLFFDSSLSTCPKKMETVKWPKAADPSLKSLKMSSKSVTHFLEKSKKFKNVFKKRYGLSGKK